MGETSFPDTFRAFRAHAGTARPTSEVARDLAGAPVRMGAEASAVPLGMLRDGASLRYTASCLAELDPGVLEVVLAGRWLEGYDVIRTLSRVLCPALFVEADFAAGGALPGDYARELASELPDVVHVRTPGVGHNVHATQPEAWLRVVLPFLSSL
jgi:pimeloyl-ACP methyl ester carboxylesterase